MNRHRPRLLFHVEALWGVGHLVRCLRLLQALRQKFECYLVSGSSTLDHFPLPCDLHVIRLQSVHFTTDYTELVADDGSEVQHSLDKRCEEVVAAFLAVQPDVVVLEMFPFGRHVLAEESLSLLQLAYEAGVPAGVSLRDVYVYPENESERACYLRSVQAVLDEFSPTVLVHSDQNVQPTTAAIPLEIKATQCSIVHTGYVGHKEIRRERTTERSCVLCSIGGGRVGGEVLLKRIAHVAREMCNCVGKHCKTIRMITGPHTPEDIKTSLHRSSGLFTEILPFDGSLAFSLPVDVSGLVVTGGYNSWMDAVAYRVPTLVLPIDDEQRIRSHALSRVCPWVRTISEEMSHEEIITVWQSVVKSDQVPFPAIAFDGARISADILGKFV